MLGSEKKYRLKFFFSDKTKCHTPLCLFYHKLRLDDYREKSCGVLRLLNPLWIMNLGQNPPLFVPDVN